MSDVPSGWYPDPQGLEDERYHDGTDWTSQTRKTAAPEPAAKVSPRGTDERLMKMLVRTQYANMHYTRVLVLVVVWFAVNAFFGAVFTLILTITVSNEPGTEGIRGITVFIWIVACVWIAWLMGSAINQARKSRKEIGEIYRL